MFIFLKFKQRKRISYCINSIKQTRMERVCYQKKGRRLHNVCFVCLPSFDVIFILFLLFFLYPFGLLKSGAADFLCLDAPHFGVFISNTAFVFGFEPALTEKRLLK